MAHSLFSFGGQDAALDKLVEKLQRTYFATYGYSFPLTGKSWFNLIAISDFERLITKMSNLVHTEARNLI